MSLNILPIGGGSATGGDVGGASSLTTGHVPYVVSAGVLGQDTNIFTWDATNNRLGIGTPSPSQMLDIVGATAKLQLNRDTASTRLVIENSGSVWYINALDANGVAINTNGTERVRVATTTGNVVIGGITDNNFKLDIANSGSAGTARVYDQTASTGVSQLFVRAGAGQSSTALTTFQNNAGTTLATITSAGNYSGPQVLHNAATPTWSLSDNLAALGSAGFVKWSSTTSYSGSADTGLARTGAGVLEVNSGTLSAYRDLVVRDIILTGTAPASAADTGTAGRVRVDTGFIYVCTATNTWKRVAIATW